MAKDKIIDLRHHLFAQLERLSDDESMKNPIKLEREILRSKAIATVSKEIISTAKLEVDFLKVVERSNGTIQKPGFLGIDESKK